MAGAMSAGRFLRRWGSGMRISELFSRTSGWRDSVEVRAVDIAQRPAIDQDAVPPLPEGVDQHRFTGVQDPNGRSAGTATSSNVDPRLRVALQLLADRRPYTRWGRRDGARAITGRGRCVAARLRWR